MKIKELENHLGTLSKPSKMPGFSFSIPAQKCITGSKLRLKKNSTCSSCYALKGRYVFPNVKDALFNRLNKMNSLGFPVWIELMTELISRKEKKGFFRWHDSGDLQSIEHLKAIIQIARNLPGIKFWLPTREIKILKDYLKDSGSIPDNLNIRISAFCFYPGELMQNVIYICNIFIPTSSAIFALVLLLTGRAIKRALKSNAGSGAI